MVQSERNDERGMVAAGNRRPGAKRSRGLGAVLALASLCSVLPSDAVATRINSAGDPALSGALVQTFDAATVGYFTSQSFLIGSHGFTIAAVAGNVHIDDVFCGNFGTSGRCFDTVNSSGTANDDVDITFTGSGVSAFGFAVNALDIDWTVQTFGVGNVLLGTYVINSQSPGLTGDNRRGFFGATETGAIQSIRIRSTGSDRALIDDFRIVPVPEPGPAIMLGLGLAGLAGAGSRRSRQR